MNILITGSHGFIGRNLSKQLNNKYGHTITELHRGNCDLLDPESVDNFFQKSGKAYDLVLHTAVEGGRRTKTDSPDIVYKNLLMLYNLLSHQRYYQCIISFGSGAELDRRYDINDHAINRYPIDYYGLSKNVIDKLCAAEPKLCNFRIFNCFGIDENDDRMIKSNIIRYLNKEDIIIHQNRKMDFFYIDDLSLLIHSLIDANNIPKAYDCCYHSKYSLYEIGTMINNCDDHKVNIIVENEQMAKDYHGISAKININYVGLEQAIRTIHNYYKDKITDE